MHVWQKDAEHIPYGVIDDLIVLNGCELFHCTPSEFEDEDISVLRLMHLKSLLNQKTE